MSSTSSSLTTADGDSQPTSNSCYGSASYWDNRYSEEDSYEWLQSYCAFQHLIHQYLGPPPSSMHILMIGCGNSDLSKDMHRDGYTNIVNTDISEVCIANQRAKYPDLEWSVADVTALTSSFDVGSFDAVVEKATIDTLLVGQRSPWTVEEATAAKVQKALQEISLVLKEDGKFLSFTFSQPHFRLPLVARHHFNWNVKYETFSAEHSFHFFLFIMTKGEVLDDNELQKVMKILHSQTLDRQKVMESLRSDEEQSFVSSFNFDSDNDNDDG